MGLCLGNMVLSMSELSPVCLVTPTHQRLDSRTQGSLCTQASVLASAGLPVAWNIQQPCPVTRPFLYPLPVTQTNKILKSFTQSLASAPDSDSDAFQSNFVNLLPFGNKKLTTGVAEGNTVRQFDKIGPHYWNLDRMVVSSVMVPSNCTL